MARSFNGSTDRIIYSNIANTESQPCTISLWLYPNSVELNQFIFAPFTSSNTQPHSMFRIPGSGTARLGWFVGYDSNNLTHDTDNNFISVSQWQHFLVTWDGSTIANNAKIYKNGVESSTYLISQDGSGIERNGLGNLFLMGRHTDDRSFNGILAESAYWDRVLSLSEIVSLSKGFAPSFYLNGLRFYSDLIRDVRDIMGNNVVTLTGTNVTNHPPIIYPDSPSIFVPSVAIPPVTGKVLRHPKMVGGMRG